MTEPHDQPDIDFTAVVEAEEMRFSEAPESRVDFFGNPAFESASGSERTGLPGNVDNDVTYRRVRVDYRIRSQINDDRIFDQRGFNREGD